MNHSIRRLITETKSSSITSRNNCKMDTKLAIEIKEEESVSDDVASQNETEFFHKVVTMKRKSDAVLLDDHCNMPIKTEIKSETPHLANQSETVVCSSNWEIDRKTQIEQQIPTSDFGSQSKGELLSEDPAIKLVEFDTDFEMVNKIEIKEEPLWFETETLALCDVKVEDFPPVNYSSLYQQDVSSYTSDLLSSEHLGDDMSCSTNKDGSECEIHGKCESQKSVLSDISLQHLKTQKLNHERIKSHKCDICNKAFTQSSNMKTHRLIHEGIKPHICNICNKAFTCVSNLKKHKLIHEGIKSHKCYICNKAFTLLSHLKRHRLIHEGIKSHKCNICNKAFTLLTSLKTHKLTHQDIKPHKCNFCNKAFGHLSNLRNHKLIHEGIKKHKCNICNKSFTHLQHLKKHVWIHEGIKPHKCNVCNKAFVESTYLKNHKLIHEDVQPHKCNICDKVFVLSSSLKRHKLIHEGIKPYKCNICNKPFTSLSNLKRHKLIHKDR